MGNYSTRPRFRHEQKYLISEQESLIIRKRLELVMRQDVHTDNGNGYFIRSLYFDDLWENALNEKLAGTSSRKKYRIRIYDHNDSTIKLERKRKEGQFIQKTFISLSRDEMQMLIAGEYSFLWTRKEPLAKEFYLDFHLNQMKPAVIVDYVRIPYVYQYGNVRITFDAQVSAGVFKKDILDKNMPVYEVLDHDTLIMEVKYTEYLPDQIRDLLATQDSVYIAASKYVLCMEKMIEMQKLKG